MTTSPQRLHPALAPADFAGLRLGNRLAVAPMTRVSATAQGLATAEMAAYYTDFAHGGFGLIITEGTYTDSAYSQGYANQPGIVSTTHTAAWQRVTDRVHAAGSRIVLQLMHAGALAQGNRFRPDTAAPSAVRPRGEQLANYGGGGPWPVPVPMTQEEITEAVRGFADSAARAREAGFDGVEVHAANGYLLDQFLTDCTNLRTDCYGGPIGQRVRLMRETVAAVRSATGHGFTVGVRFSQAKVNDHAHRWAGGTCEAETIFTAASAAGADYLHIAGSGRDWFTAERLDDGRTVAAVARESTGLPVIANGGMHDPDQAARVLEEGHADLLSVGTGALANPDLPRRLEGRAEPARFDPAVLKPLATLANARRVRAGQPL
ncbi:NADH:flavin oxidoreductase [Streptomyces sp. ISL-98]|uniref:oxidoreductase n=1 Tax=Streptomyces sp. ISL-98 TaxID=2819192 RepID=UPI001BEC647B|nr:NADH:flavin oxidoreductase [Streptomyces sp. ISL-98]MBT2507212.1 NADH:flavin oxidoreductase [Streptomyces sp. ISL-98]